MPMLKTTTPVWALGLSMTLIAALCLWSPTHLAADTPATAPEIAPASAPDTPTAPVAPTAQPASTVVHPDWSYNASIYEVNIRQHTLQGTFKAFQAHLPRLQKMGVGILWLMPIHPIGELNRKGTLGSHYAVKDFRKVNPDYGTLDDFKALVDDAHERGMRIILDWVPNHTAWDNPLTLEHPDWYTKDDQGNFTPPVPDWNDVIDLDYDHPGLNRYMLDSLAYWVREADIDGYRVDVAGMVPLEFWAQARQELSEIKPVFLLAEWDDPAAHRDAYDMTYAWSLNGVFHRIVAGKATPKDLWAHLKEEDTRIDDQAIRMYFTSNHDENSWNGSAIERYGDAAEAFAVLTLTLDGMPLVYNGQEAGLDRRLAFFDKDPIDWADHSMAEVYTKLLNLRKANKALAVGGRGGAVKQMDQGSKEFFSFTRQRDGDGVVVTVNLTDQPIEVMLMHPPLGSGDYTDALTGEVVLLKPGTKITLKPWGYRVWIH